MGEKFAHPLIHTAITMTDTVTAARRMVRTSTMSVEHVACHYGSAAKIPEISTRACVTRGLECSPLHSEPP